jgi:hypothetical protein
MGNQMKAPPKQVRAAAAAAEDILKQNNTPDPLVVSAEDDAAIDKLLQDATAPSPERVPEPKPEVKSEPEPERNDWKQKYSVLQGKYDAEVPRLHEDVRNLKAQLDNLARAQQAPAPAPQELKRNRYLKEDEVEEFGEEFFDMIGRRAKEVAETEFAPLVASLREEVRQLRGQVGHTGELIQRNEQDSFYTQLAIKVPDWEQINNSSTFLAWLGKEIPDTNGRTRHSELMEAFNERNVANVAKYFKTFTASVQPRNEEHAQSSDSRDQGRTGSAPTLDLNQFVSPSAGQGSPQSTPSQGSQKIWTQSEISSFYSDVRNGKYRNRGADKAKIEEAIVKAGIQGRVR